MPEAREITYRASIIEALRAEMREDPSIVVLGEDVGAAGGVFKQTEGLFAEFGAERVIDTPISESGAFGIAVGAAMTGLRPVFEVMFGDFLTLVMDQLVNQAAKIYYMSNGLFSAPLALRTTIWGRTITILLMWTETYPVIAYIGICDPFDDDRRLVRALTSALRAAIRPSWDEVFPDGISPSLRRQ